MRRLSSLALACAGASALGAFPGCMTLADPVATGGSGAYIATGGTAAGSGGASGGAAGTGAAGSGGTSGSGAEDCQNGVDDDEDGKLDCADTDCASGFSCATVPSGWTAVLAATQPWASNLPISSCAAGLSATRYFSGPATQSACSTCTCGALTGGNCGSTPITCTLGDTACGNPASINVGTCANFSAPGNGQISCSLGATPLASGSCTPSTSTLLSPDPWHEVVDVCPLPAAGCAGDSACVSTQDGTGPVACVVAPGATSCPADWPTAKVVYTGGSDGRKCGSCKCSTASVTCASDSFSLMVAPDCVDFGPYPTFTSTSCKSYTLSGQPTWSLQRAAASKKPSGSCTPSGGAAYGAMNPTGKTTLCCRG